MLGFAVGAFYALSRHPIYGLMTYVAVYYLHPPARWWGAPIAGYRWSLLAAGITLLAVIIHARKRQPPTVPLFKHKVMIGLMLFFGWLVLQSFSALDQPMHHDMITLFAKYVLLVGLIYLSVDSERHLKWFLWTHVLGCAYLGWIAYTAYEGGRFEGFGGPDINEANAGALQIVTGILCASVLLLMGKTKERLFLLGTLPFIVNALVTTVSRSGFLEVALGGIVFNWFSLPRFKKIVRVLSIVAVLGFLVVTDPGYWLRISSMKYAGEQVQGVDTGEGRIVLVKAQWQMFFAHPFGCGHRCTAVLSPEYLDDSRLTGQGKQRARSSHNSFMTMLVEHGVVGALFYVALLVWIYRSVRFLARKLKGQETFLAAFMPAIAAIMAALTIGDLFVDYVLQEVRMWFVAILMVCVSLASALPKAPPAEADTKKEVPKRLPKPRRRLQEVTTVERR